MGPTHEVAIAPCQGSQGHRQPADKGPGPRSPRPREVRLQPGEGGGPGERALAAPTCAPSCHRAAPGGWEAAPAGAGRGPARPTRVPHGEGTGRPPPSAPHLPAFAPRSQEVPALEGEQRKLAEGGTGRGAEPEETAQRGELGFLSCDPSPLFPHSPAWSKGSGLQRVSSGRLLPCPQVRRVQSAGG